MKLIKLFCLLTLFVLLNCQKKNDKSSVITENLIKSKTDSRVKPNNNTELKEITLPKSQAFTKDFLEIEDAEINGHQIVLSLAEFDRLYPTKDSLKTDVWECGSPFEWLDENWMIKTYGRKNSQSGTFERFDGKISSVYTHSAEFNSNKHIVLFNTADAAKNNFEIKSHHILLNQNTTIEEFQKLFPQLKKEITDQKNVFRFRISVGKDRDDAFLFYFKDGKLEEFVLWWLLC
jgi:hypothetical protein